MERAADTATLEKVRSPRGLQDAFLDERNDVLAVINELEDQLDRNQEIRETLERELTGTTEKLQTANQRTQELEWQVVTLQTRVDALEQLRTDIASLEEELNDANARAQRVSEQLTGSEKERIRLKGELKAASKQVDELWPIRKERDGLRSDYKILSAKVEELERTQRELHEERTALQSELHELQATLEATASERNQVQITMRGLEDRIRELTQVQEALEDKVEALRAEKKSLQVQIAHLERENARLVEQRQFYECEVTSLRNQSRTAEAALASVKKAFSEVRIALTETKSRARRRALDTWPRVGSPLRGIPVREPNEGPLESGPGGIMAGATSIAGRPVVADGALSPVSSAPDLAADQAAEGLGAIE
jgi:chromosome segregation ATPase